MIKEVNSNFIFLKVLCVVHIICGLALILVLEWLQILERPVDIDNLAHETSNFSKYDETQIFFPFQLQKPMTLLYIFYNFYI